MEKVLSRLVRDADGKIHKPATKVIVQRERDNGIGKKMFYVTETDSKDVFVVFPEELE